MPVGSLTRNDIAFLVGQETGLLFGNRRFAMTAQSQAPSGFPPYVDSQELPASAAGQVAGLFLYVPTGGGSGNARTVVTMRTPSFSAPSPLLALTRLYLDRSMAVSTNALMELWRGHDRTNVNEMIGQAVRAVQRQMLDHKEDYAIQLDDLLRHRGSFERWPGGTTSAPAGWTLSGTGATVTREATIKYSGLYSAALLSDGTNSARLESDDVEGFPSFAGTSLTAYAKLFTRTAGRVSIAITDGVGTTSSNTWGTANGWNGAATAISVTRTIDGNPSQLRVRVDISAGGAVTVYCGKVWLVSPSHIYEFDLPVSGTSDEGFAYASELWLESTVQDGVFNVGPVPHEWWDIDAGRTTPRLILKKDNVEHLLAAGRQVRLVGQRWPRVPTADSSIVEVDPEYLVKATALRLLIGQDWSDMERSKYDRFRADVERYVTSLAPAVYPDSIPVEAISA